MDPDNANQSTNSSPKTEAINDLVDSMSRINLGDDHSETDKLLDNKNAEHPARTLLIYPRPQMLKLYKSPLVKPPDGMPALKDWFGSENEQTMHKKEGEGSSPPSARDRRFRRDPEDGDPPARPSFRGTTTQPSQMGNFKHQSIRSTDRNDRDKDGEKERERDIRDKEGQERLRNLSEKYDRDRLAHPSNSTNLRNKEREMAPHLSAGSSRANNRDGPLNPASRRPEPREGPKKKTIEASEDWRRGADSLRTGRDDRTDNSRRDRDRDDRERPRSRVRDTSRPRRERSTSRRDREQRDRDRDRERERRGDRDRDDYRRDRDDYRRERDDYLRRDRDLDKDVEVDVDDPRRWRDDGKRDERVAARREREHRDRIRDRLPREEGWEDRHGGRWTVVEDRDSRNKRSSGRDRRSGILDDGKEKDDRKERDRGEREKEKEPAWMDTYIPTGTGAGILGGKGGDGELDGIQAFKKGMKAKEQKDLSSPEEALEASHTDKQNGSSTAGAISSAALSSDKPLDEIQLFKLMMKKEQEQKKSQKLPTSVTEPTLTGPTLKEVENGGSGLARTRDQRTVSTPLIGEPGVPSVSEPQSAVEQPSSAMLPKGTSTPTPPNERTLDTPKTLLSILSNSNGPTPAPPSTTTPTTPSLDSVLPKPSGSRFFPRPLTSDSPVTSDQGSTSSQAPPQFNPPPGSRLLAFGARNSSGGPGLPNTNQQPSQQLQGIHPSLQQQQQQQQQGLQMPLDAFQNAAMSLPQLSDINHRPAMSEAMRAQQGFPPFELQSRSAFALDDSRDAGNYGHNVEPLRRTSVASPADRPSFSASESSSTYSSMSGSHAVANPENFSANGPTTSFDPMNNGQYSSGKGSRFLKYFEDKGRDGQTPGIRKPQGPIGFQSSSPNPGQRQDQIGFNGAHAENRMDELFAMLVQGQRANSVNQMGPGPAPAGGHFGQNNAMQSLHHQQMHHQQHLTPNNRLDSLYESRLDDRNFVPDGMVPGLRQAPPPRNRENNGMFTDPLDDPMQFNPHRLPPQQRVLDMYPGAGPSMYAQPSGGGRHAGIPLQQPQFRGNPSPNPLQGPAQQRLPPGLANLGGRPPHEPSQFIGSSLGMQPGGIHGPLHGNGPSPQPFNNFGAGAGLGGYGGNPQMRGPPLGAHQLPNAIGPNQMGHPSGGMDMRGPSNQAQLLGLGGGPNVGGSLRGPGGGFVSQQGPPMQAPLMAMRQQQQQQQQHLPPHMMPPQTHHLPPHLQQSLPGANTQDLMALLMGNGSHRE